MKKNKNKKIIRVIITLLLTLMFSMFSFAGGYYVAFSAKKKELEKRIIKLNRIIRGFSQKRDCLFKIIKELHKKLEKFENEIRIKKEGDICYVYSGKCPLENVKKRNKGYIMRWLSKKREYWGVTGDTFEFDLVLKGNKGEIKVKINFKKSRMKIKYKGAGYEGIKELHIPENFIERVIRRGK